MIRPSSNASVPVESTFSRSKERRTGFIALSNYQESREPDLTFANVSFEIKVRAETHIHL